MDRNGRKSCSNVRSKSWVFLIYYSISPRAIPRHSIHRSRRHLKAWLIAFNFDCSSAPPGSDIFFNETFQWGAARLIIHHGCFAPSELPQNAIKHPIYGFVMHPRNWPETVVKIVLMPVQRRGSSIYYPMSLRAIARLSVHGSRRRLKAWLIAFNFDCFSAFPGKVLFFAENLPMGCRMTYKASWVVRTIWLAP